MPVKVNFNFKISRDVFFVFSVFLTAVATNARKSPEINNNNGSKNIKLLNRAIDEGDIALLHKAIENGVDVKTV